MGTPSRRKSSEQPCCTETLFSGFTGEKPVKFVRSSPLPPWRFPFSFFILLGPEHGFSHLSYRSMAPSAQSHGRSHSLLLVQKLFNLRDGASPLTLVLDHLEQNAAPLLREFTGRAKVWMKDEGQTLDAEALF